MSGPLKHALQIVPIPTISQRLFPEARQKSMPMITTVISLHILYYPADKICSIPYTDHINNSSRSDVFPYCEKNNRKYGGIHNELPCAKTHMQKAADPQIHAGKGIYAKITQPVTADADADKQDACQHHNRPPANGCFFLSPSLMPPAFLLSGERSWTQNRPVLRLPGFPRWLHQM